MSEKLRDQLKSLTSRVNVRPVQIPEWDLGETIHVREMNADEFEHFRASRMERDEKGRAHWNSRGENVDLIILCACDAQGIPLFDATDRDWLKSLPFAGVRRIVDAAMELNGLTEEDESRSDGLDGETLKNSSAENG